MHFIDFTVWSILHSKFAFSSVEALVILSINEEIQRSTSHYLLGRPKANHSGRRRNYSHALIKGYLSNDFEDNTAKTKLFYNTILATAL